MILSAMVNRPPHPDLHGLTHVGGVTLVSAAIAPADMLVLCGDGQTLAIKYWSISSLLSAIRLKQFEAILVGLREQSPWAYGIIGGILAANADGVLKTGLSSTGWRWEAIQGALLSAQEIGVGMVQTQHCQFFGAMVEQLARRNRAPVKPAPMRDSFWPSPAEQVLMALPGIGEALAERIAVHCGDAATALQALTDDHAPLVGVGPKTRQAIRDALGLAPDEVLVRAKITDMALDQPRKAA